jgi:hypothetical protein
MLVLVILLTSCSYNNTPSLKYITITDNWTFSPPPEGYRYDLGEYGLHFDRLLSTGVYRFEKVADDYGIDRSKIYIGDYSVPISLEFATIQHRADGTIYLSEYPMITYKNLVEGRYYRLLEYSKEWDTPDGKTGYIKYVVWIIPLKGENQ